METVHKKRFAGKRLFVLDMDGTFYLGDRILPGAADFLKICGETGRSYLFFTNNSSHTGAFYRRRLAGMHCTVEDRQIVTSGDVTIDFLKRERPGARIFLLGNSELCASFEKAGIRLVDDRPDIVIAAFDTELTYRRVTMACDFLRGGAEFLATHPDINCPTDGGFVPDCGAICAMITASTGRHPRSLGKPNRETLDAVVSLTGFDKDEIVFVGDRLYTDIAIGAKNNVTSVLVLSGETAREDLARSDVQPSFVYPSIAELAAQIAAEGPAL